MTDSREDENETGFDQTNGLAPGIEGDDGGSVDPTPESNVIDDVIGDLADPDRIRDDRGEPDGDDGETPYSEEGRP